MTTYYVDPSQSVQGDGSPASPYTTLTGVTPADGDIFLFKCGTTYRENLSTDNLAANNLTFSSYGEGNKPILTSEINPAWVQDATYPQLYVYTFGSNVGGLALENGTPLNHTNWTTDLATTFATMSVGTFVYDSVNFKLYVWPKTSPANCTASSFLYGMFSTSSYTNLNISNLEFYCFSRHGIALLNRQYTIVENCNFTAIGGNSSGGGTPVGNGVEIGHGSHNSKVLRCNFKRIFDSPITFQVYSNSNTVRNGEAAYNVIEDGGLYGIEITIVGSVTNCILSNIYVHNNKIKNVGYNFRAKSVTGRGIHVGGAQATSIISGILVKDNVLENNRWGLSDSTGGNTVTSVAFVNNTVVTSQTPTNGRGIYTSGSCLYLGNVIVGYFYGIGSYGTATRTTKIYNCVIDKAEEAIQQDANTGTLEIKNCVIWSNSRLVRIAVSGLTTTFQYNYWRSGITNGGLTVDGTNTRVSTFPLTTTYLVTTDSALKYTGTFLNQLGYHNPPSIGPYEYIPERGTR